jgi:hypothetical protein
MESMTVIAGLAQKGHISKLFGSSSIGRTLRRVLKGATREIAG